MKTYGGFFAARTHQLCGRVFDKLLRKNDVDAFNEAQSRILCVLWEYGQLSISEIGKYTSLAKTTLTGMLDRMERNGLVGRTPDKRDHRQTFVTATEKAKKYRDKYNQTSDQMNAIFYNGFSESEIKQFEDTLERIIHNLETHEGAE